MRDIFRFSGLLTFILITAMVPIAFAHGANTHIAGIEQIESSNPEDVHWLDRGFCLDGLNGPVYALTEFDGKLIAGGHFTIANCSFATNIAAWDGSHWSQLGEGITETVYALTVYHNKLIASGSFGVRSWDGNTWSDIGFGQHAKSAVGFLAVFQGNLVVAGVFDTAGTVETRGIAAWNGVNWLALGNSPVVDGYIGVVALTIYNSKLIAGVMSFEASGTTNLVAWDGTLWTSMTFIGPVNALAVWNGMLVVGGSFNAVGPIQASNVAAWDGSTWYSLGSPISRTVTSLLSLNGKLVAGSDSVYTYEAGIWRNIGTITEGGIKCLAEFDNKLVAGGGFLPAGPAGSPQNSVTAWDGSHWSRLQSGWICSGGPLTVYDGKLIVGGSVLYGDSVIANGIAAWDRHSWSKLGSGIEGTVNALVVFGNKLICGGNISSAGGNTVGGIAAWDGSTWEAVGHGFDGQIQALIVYNGELVAGGSSQIDGFSTGGIAKWNGSAWTALGSGVNGHVKALAISAGKLIVGGDFMSAGGVAANCVATWDGSQWAPLGAGMSGYIGSSVDALADLNGKIFAADNYGMSQCRIVMWDGNAFWHQLAEYAGSSVFALTTYQGRLIVGGTNNLNSFDGNVWSGFGSGVHGGDGGDGAVFSAFPYGDDLMVSGYFETAGDKISSNLADWNEIATEVVDVDISNLPEQTELQQNYPNPFNPETTLEFDIPRPAFVSLDIYDILGRHVRTLVNEYLKAGTKRVVWDGRDDAGYEVSSGVYLYQLKAGDISESRKMVLLK